MLARRRYSEMTYESLLILKNPVNPVHCSFPGKRYRFFPFERFSRSGMTNGGGKPASS